MGDLLAQLVPEILGLAVTPAAIVACLLLLGSHRPYRNVAVFGGTVMVVYAVLGAVVLSLGRTAGTQETADPGTVRGWIGLVVGVLFLAVGVLALVRARAAPPGPPSGAEPEVPGWARRLAQPTTRVLVVSAVVLALVNPNVAIFLSGLGMVLTADVTVAEQAAGVLVLVVASVLDYVIPTAFYAATGLPGRRRLTVMRFWLVHHDRAIGAAVLLVFGALFTVRGLVQVLG
ncbi:GAP family protein [Promicromonospora sp. NPDC052451]|uniref:GAP family protein n=1 Tax=Promicromonospora sp. NPDC052451 TaxID=3364407 RepID=UPI0037C5E025